MTIKGQLPIAIDLFCGVGGMALGFERAGFKIAGAFDLEPRHIETYRRNFGATSTHALDLSTVSGSDIRRLTGVGKSRVHVIFGGPPCQGFSVGGRRDKTDPRNKLLLDFARIVTEIKPCYFVAENVGGLLQGYGISVVKRFCKIVRDAGYDVVEPIKTLDAADFGVPQRRVRTFILGYRRSLTPLFYPEPRPLIDPATRQPFFPTVRDAISDLPELEAYDHLLTSDGFDGELGSPSPYVTLLHNRFSPRRKMSRHAIGLTGCLRTVHSRDTIRRFSKTLPGTAEPISRYIRLQLDDVSPTLRAGTGSERGSHTAPRPIHPTLPRCITVREAARLHSFPDWFQFHNTRWHAFRQIGNSVPPTLALAVATQVANKVRTLGN